MPDNTGGKEKEMAIDGTAPTTSRAENYAKYAEYFEDEKSNSTLSIETFFTLLMAEMSNQDPLEPQSNTEFISQLANFTALQNSSNTLYYNTVSYAASLAGKTVTVATAKADGKGLNVETGVVTGVDISDGNNIEITVNGRRYLLSNIMNVGGTAASTSTGSDGAYAVSLIGKKVMLYAETDDGVVIDEGIVENIEVENGVYRVVVNGLSYTLDTVVKVSNPSGSTAAQPGNTGTNDKVTDDTDSDDKVTDDTDSDDKVTDTEEDTEVEEGETGNTETSIMEENEALKELFS